MDRIDLIVIGGNLAGLSVAIEAQEAGLEDVLVLERGTQVSLPDLVGQHGLVVRYRSPVSRIAGHGDSLIVEVGDQRWEATAVVMAERPVFASRPPDYPIPPALADRVHLSTVPTAPHDLDVLVVGRWETAVEWALQLSRAGRGVVLALGGSRLERLSRLARRVLFRLEAERSVTILWESAPDAVEEVDGHPMAFFDDRQTPDLQFDHIVYALGPAEVVNPFSDLAVSVEAPPSGSVWFLWVVESLVEIDEGVRVCAPGAGWESVRAARFPHLQPAPSLPETRRHDDGAIRELRNSHYNATITHFDRAHSDLWVLRVRPDHGDASHLPGQYASVGLGYWETRGDGAQEPDLDSRWERLIRRSYSISSPIFDEHGYLVDVCERDELEFYIVLVPPSGERLPALTPRLALKRPGDRIYLGPRVAGRYTLAPVTDPFATVVFLATGTGEAPHNAMIGALLRKGHRGPIVSVVSVRHRTDLGYLKAHAALEERFDNYHYLPLTTRDLEPGQQKLYIQDVVRDQIMSERFGVALDPRRAHVYLCGHPGMIGLPDWTGPVPVFPAPVGVAELLVGLGFDLDRRGHVGNVHYEEYW